MKKSGTMRKIMALILSVVVVITLMPQIGSPSKVSADETANSQPNYLTFTAVEDNSSITFKWAGGTNVQIKNNTDTEWSDYAAGTKIELSNIGDSVSFRGKNVTTDYNNHFAMTGKIKASGSVTSLADEKGNDPDVKLSDQCYQNMFYGCTSLETAPELPAVKLTFYCYNEMFKDCTSLKTAPKLPATSLATGCYVGMFDGCISLKTAPDLPATSLPSLCYECMFKDCTSLEITPELPATDLAEGCYHAMFAYCINLETMPKLPTPDDTKDNSYYMNMFGECTKLVISTEIDENHSLPWIAPQYSKYIGTFDGADNVDFGNGSKVPEAGKTYYTKCYHDYNSDNECTICGYTKAEPNYLTFTAAEDNSSVTFKWKSADNDKVQIKKSADAEWSDYTAGTKIELSNIGDSVSFRGKNVITDKNNHFEMSGLIDASGSVTSLTDENGNDPGVKLSDSCYQYMFYQCTGLKTAPELSAINLAEACYCFMFSECKNLETAPQLPATILKAECYGDMFSYCTSLETAPQLPATKLAQYCYYNMFRGCSNLIIDTVKNEEHSLPWSIAIIDSKSSGMFSGATSVNFANGTSFPTAGVTYYTKCYHQYDSDNKCTICGWEKKDTTIDAVDINLTAPKPNESLNTTAICSIIGVKNVSDIAWTKADGTAVSENEKVQYGTKYYANITLTAADGYAFTNSTAVKCNDKTCDDVEVKLNSNGTLSIKIPFTAAKKISYTATGYTGTYDGKTHGITVNVTDPADATIMYSLNQVTGAKNEFKDVGTYKLYYYINKEGYEPVWGTCDIVINPNPIEASVNVENKTYDGTTDATVSAEINTGIDGEKLTVTGVTGSFAEAGAGKNKQVNINSTNADIEADQNTKISNYTVTYPKTATADITPKPVILKADDKEKHAGKADPEFTYTVKDNGLVSGDELKDIQFTRNGGENAGNYDISIVVPAGSNPNYDITSENGTLTVKDHTYSEAAYTWSYDNTECTAVKKCTECDEQITETVKAKITEVQKLSCTSPEIKSFEAAFTKAGFEKQVKENVQTAEALGHKWDDGVITKEPTYTADGEKKFTCSICNETRTEVIKKLVDNEAPKVEISCAANKWNQFLNTITFGYFFKETKEVSITASDDQTKNPEIWYFLSDKAYSEAELKSDDISWIRYTGKVSLQKNSKNIIYAKAVDDAGNITVVNSDGIVIYTDSVETDSISFNRLQTEDVKTDITVNGNTVSKIMIGDTEVKAEDISKAVEIKNDTLVFKAEYLNTIRPGTYTVTVSYDPMGEKYVGNDKNDAPKDSVIALTINRIKGELTVDAKALNKTYDGAAVADPVISTKNDTVDGKVKYEYKQRNADDSTYTSTAPKDAGEYTVKVTVAADYTYTEAVVYADFTISKKAVDITWSDADFTFNGKAQKPTAAVADKDICKGDTADVAVSVNDGGIDAGEHKAQAYIQNSNYVISTTDQETFTYTIKPKKITLTANDKVKHVGEKNPRFDYTAEGLVEGFTDLVNIGTRVEAGESAGVYKIFVEEISTGVNPNYDITMVPGTLTIVDHTYADTTYTWSDDNTKCTAARKCTFCDKTDTETAESKAEVTQEKTCTLPELTRYTVAFRNENGTDFADQIKENVQTAEATGHKWNNGVQSKAPTYTEEGEMLYTCEVCGDTKTEVIEKLKLNEYDILEGADGIHVLKEDGSYAVRVNCAIEYFVAVQIDGKEVDSEDYTVESGSTIVTFTKEFMDSLSVGDHEVKFIFTNGTAKAAIKVVEKTQDTVDKPSSSTDTPASVDKAAVKNATTKDTTAKTPVTQQKKAAKSGDENPAMWVLFLMMFGGAGTVTYGMKRKKTRL